MHKGPNNWSWALVEIKKFWMRNSCINAIEIGSFLHHIVNTKKDRKRAKSEYWKKCGVGPSLHSRIQMRVSLQVMTVYRRDFL